MSDCLSSGLPDNLCTNFSGVHNKVPKQVRIVKSTNDAIRAIRSGLKQELPVNFRGFGHSFGDSCVTEGMLICNRIRERFERCSSSEFLISSGFTWSEVERRLATFGRRSPVLTNWLDVSVGGTVSVGGYGFGSFLRGSQVDNVSEITLIDAEVQVRTISPQSDLSTWSIASCCLGRLGFVTSVRLTTMPSVAHVRLLRIDCHSAGELAARMLKLAETTQDCEMLMGQMRKGFRTVSLGMPYNDGSELKEIQTISSREPRSSLIDRSYQSWLLDMQHREFHIDRVRLWADFIVHAKHLTEMTHFIDAHAFRDEVVDRLRSRSRVLCLKKPDGATATQLLSPRNVDGECLFGIGVYLEPLGEDPDGILLARRILRDVLELTQSLGGRPYLCGWHEGDLAVGSLAPDLARARKQLQSRAQDSIFNTCTMPSI
jgi:hypothetical protein